MMALYNGRDRVPKSTTVVHVDTNVTTIEDRAFFDHACLTSLVIPENVTKIGRYAFFGCRCLKSVVLPSTITEIDVCAFYDCASLSSIEIPSSITVLGGHVFSGCSSLRSIIIPSSVTQIGGYTFSYCSSLIAVFVPPSVTYIGNGAFQGCTSLSSIAIPPSVQYVGFRAFDSCTELERAVPCKKHLTPWLKQRFMDLPLQYAYYNPEIIGKEITSITKRNPDSIESKDKLGLTALHILACKSNVEISTMRNLLQICPDLAGMSTFNGMSPISLFLRCKGLSFDKQQGRLPLCDALEQGIGLSDIKLLLTLDQLFCLEQRQKKESNKFYPFIVAAGLKQCNLDIVYTLARENVELLRPY